MSAPGALARRFCGDASANHMSAHCAIIYCRIQWRVTELYGRNCVGGSKDAAKIVYSVYSDVFCHSGSAETLAYAASQAALQGASGAPRP